MKKLIGIIVGIVVALGAVAQATPDLKVEEVRRIEMALASDEMRVRRAGTPDIDRAAEFISTEFKKAGLQPLSGTGFLQEFTMVRARPTKMKVEINDNDIDASNVMVISTQPEVKIDEKSGYEFQMISKGQSLGTKARQFMNSGKNLVVMVDTSFAQSFPRLSFLRNQMFPMDNSVVFILGSQTPASFKIKAEHQVSETRFANVVGVLPGKSKKEEYVIFSAHYDHLGVTAQVKNGDSIFNGANDDAAGTTAVITLANYFKKLGNNERTIVFAAFTAEEMGGFGSRYFSEQLEPAQVMAMFNIEMIGTESKWGKNSAYITGFDKTSMGKIMQKNLKGTAFNFHPDPYTKENLFYRSDNATLARLGVPAHTISTAKMEGEPNYHQLTDHVETLDLENMTEIIKAIAISATSIISGKDTPTRVNTESLN